MLILQRSGTCFGCPFFSISHVTNVGGRASKEPRCGLNGARPVSEYPLVVVIEDPSNPPKSCPIQHPFGTGAVEVQSA